MGLSHEAALDELMYGGLLRVSPSMPTEVDYERSDRDIFVETAGNMLTREGSPFRVPLDILPLAGTGYPRKETFIIFLHGHQIGAMFPLPTRWLIISVEKYIATEHPASFQIHTFTIPPEAMHCLRQ